MQNYGAYNQASNNGWRYSSAAPTAQTSGWHIPATSQQGYNPAYPSYDSSHQNSQFKGPSFRRNRAGSTGYTPTRITLTQSTRTSGSFPKKGQNKVAKVKNATSSGINKQTRTGPIVQKQITVAPSKHSKKNKAIPKMPMYQGLNNKVSPGWGGNWSGVSAQNGESQQYRGNGSGRGRGRGGYRNKVPRTQNSKDDFPFVALLETDEAIELTVSAENIVAFHGFDSVYTTKHNYPILVEGKIYESADHYYQVKKVADLVGEIPAKLNATIREETGKYLDGGSATTEGKSWAFIAKEAIKAASVEKAKVDAWRISKGLEAVQVALHAKVAQSAQLRGALTESGDAILVHAYAGDSIYGTGCTVPKIKTWLQELEKTGTKTIKVPAEFPLTEETVKGVPVFANGRNILGVILMQLRKKLNAEEIKPVDMSAVFSAMRVTNEAEKAPAKKSGFQIGGGDMQKKLGTF